ncbi:MAG TPA: hypothetical protein VKB35_20930 [Ktedonobacteraceae bacterium]|nr:hypothetical protein [Ktedonobacteraceae bacterium]
MRAAAVALVLIIGAVVLLIFANTLNSWVLGGLIGGLAALLISIPISLFLFTILARRHDEELRALQEQLEEEMAVAGIEGREYAEIYETNAYVLSSEENFSNDPGGRRLSGAHSLPAAGQSQASVSAYGTYNQRPGNYPTGSRRPSQALSQARGKGIPTQQLAPDPHLQKHSVHEVNAMRSKYHTAALRAAQREAALESDDVEVVPPHSTAPYRRVSPEYSSQPLFEQSTQFKQVRPTRQLPPEQHPVNPNSPRRVGDAALGQKGGARRNVPSGGVYFPRAPRTDSLRSHQPQTDQLREHYPETEPVNLRSQTGQLMRNPQLVEQLRNPDMITGSLNNPLVRRAPYMYEDDPLREELAQQIDGPIMRRSSRFLQDKED